MNQEDPIAFFLTWVTYGTWLPGDARGWVEYMHGWKMPSASLEKKCAESMSEDSCRLSTQQRDAVEKQIAETCNHRNWILYAVNCRSNHVHVVVGADNSKAKKIRVDLKAYSTRCLKSLNPAREKWWADRGSIRWIFNEEDLDKVVKYVHEGQDKSREFDHIENELKMWSKK